MNCILGIVCIVFELSQNFNGDARICSLILIWDRLRLEGGCVTTKG